MFRSKRSFKKFRSAAIFCGLFLILIGIAACAGNVIAGVCIILLGIALMAGGICVAVFLFPHQSEIDESAPIYYSVSINGTPQMINSVDEIAEAYKNLQPGNEILVSFSPAYAGLVSWKFIRLKNQYVSFPTLQSKKGDMVTYFIMPRTNADEAMKQFKEMVVDKKTIDKSQCISMKKYNTIMEMYKLL